jgi:hypothetical protein
VWAAVASYSIDPIRRCSIVYVCRLQGDKMRLWKSRPKCSPIHFLLKINTQLLLLKIKPNYLRNLFNYYKTTQSATQQAKNRPIPSPWYAAKKFRLFLQLTFEVFQVSTVASIRESSRSWKHSESWVVSQNQSEPFHQDCQKLYLQISNPNFDIFWKTLQWNCLYILWPYGIFYERLVYYVII